MIKCPDGKKVLKLGDKFKKLYDNTTLWLAHYLWRLWGLINRFEDFVTICRHTFQSLLFHHIYSLIYYVVILIMHYWSAEIHHVCTLYHNLIVDFPNQSTNQSTKVTCDWGMLAKGDSGKQLAWLFWGGGSRGKAKSLIMVFKPFWFELRVKQNLMSDACNTLTIQNLR